VGDTAAVDRFGAEAAADPDGETDLVGAAIEEEKGHSEIF